MKYFLTLLSLFLIFSLSAHGGPAYFPEKVHLDFSKKRFDKKAGEAKPPIDTWKEGFGGDSTEFDVVNLLTLTRLTLIQLSLDEIRQLFETTQAVKISEQMMNLNLVIEFTEASLFLGGTEKIAINDPKSTPKKLLISKGKWNTQTDTQKRQLMIHEFLSLVGVPDYNYYFSQKVWYFLTVYPTILEPEKFGVLIENSVKKCDLTFFKNMERWNFDWSDPTLTKTPLSFIAATANCKYAIDYLIKLQRETQAPPQFEESKNPLAFAIAKRAQALNALKSDLDPNYYLETIRSLLTWISPTARVTAYVIANPKDSFYMSSIEVAIYRVIDSHMDASGKTVYLFDEPVIKMLLDAMSTEEIRNYRSYKTGQTLLEYSLDHQNLYAAQLIHSRIKTP
ncbi:hypothetical protein [Bdellovibrio bacteriovorus]|uniref:hypothetical protein n=1 Tax=Bdellovibrio TaxID=958 RepID=UPI0035A96021